MKRKFYCPPLTNVYLFDASCSISILWCILQFNTMKLKLLHIPYGFEIKKKKYQQSYLLIICKPGLHGKETIPI